MTTKRDAWIHLWATFKDGDQVLIVTDDDDYWWGTFRPTHRCCRFADGKEFPWDKVVLICHDGFPVKFLKTGVCPEWFDANRGKLSKAVRRECEHQEWLKEQARMKARDARIAEQERRHQECVERNVKPWDSEYVPSPHRYGCGDPWVIEGVFTRGFNIGGHVEDEFLDLTDRDGLKGMLFDLDGIIEAA